MRLSGILAANRAGETKVRPPVCGGTEYAMPHYHFRLDGTPTPAGPHSEWLPDDDAAWSQAVISTGELLRDLGGKVSGRTRLRATVTEDGGRIVGTLDVSSERGNQ